MTNLLAAILAAVSMSAPPAMAVGCPQSGTFSLEICPLGTAGNTWAAAQRRNFLKLSTGSVVPGSSALLDLQELRVKTIRGYEDEGGVVLSSPTTSVSSITIFAAGDGVYSLTTSSGIKVNAGGVTADWFKGALDGNAATSTDGAAAISLANAANVAATTGTAAAFVLANAANVAATTGTYAAFYAVSTAAAATADLAASTPAYATYAGDAPDSGLRGSTIAYATYAGDAPDSGLRGSTIAYASYAGDAPDSGLRGSTIAYATFSGTAGSATGNAGTVTNGMYTDSANHTSVHQALDAGATISSMTAGAANFTGNVGIGTASPGEKLDVAGNARITGALTASSGTFLATGDAVYSVDASSGIRSLGEMKATDFCIVGNKCLSGTGTGTGDISGSPATNSFPYTSAAKTIASSELIRDGATSITTASSVTVKGAFQAPYVSSATVADPWLGTPTTTRAKNTVYQNLTGKVLWVNVAMIVTGSDANTAYIGPTSSPALNVGQCGTSVVGQSVRCNQFFVVPVGWYYKVDNSGLVNIWAELN